MVSADIIAQNLRRLIKKHGTNPRALADAAKVGPTAARDILLGKSRNPTTRTLQRLAAALGVPVSELTGDDNPPGPATNGFHEPQVEPWRGSGAGRAAPEAILAAFGAGLAEPALFTSRSGVAALGVLAGDILVVDLAMRAAQGDTVLVTVADLETGAAETLLRRYVPPFVLSGDPEDPRANLRVDQTGAVVVMGVVTAIIRDELTKRRGQIGAA